MWPTLKWATTWSGGVGRVLVPDGDAPITVDMVNELIQEMRREREDRWLGVMDKGGERVAIFAPDTSCMVAKLVPPTSLERAVAALDRLPRVNDGHRGAHAA